MKGEFNMHITEKFNQMIESFECDFALARECPETYSLCDLQTAIDKKESHIIADIELLEELSFLLRHGKAVILISDEKPTKEILSPSGDKGGTQITPL